MSGGSRGSASSGQHGRRLRVNPIACDAHGVCADLLPELIELDPWGYPVISPEPVPEELIAHARRAVTACPTLALRLDTDRRSTSR